MLRGLAVAVLAAFASPAFAGPLLRSELFQAWDELGAGRVDQLSLLTAKDLQAGRKDCHELKWKRWSANPEVCAQSMMPKCVTGTFNKAQEVCEGAGGRLCTEAEISAGATTGTGCGFDDKRIWSGDACPLGAVTLKGNGKAYVPRECMSKDKLIGIRCCSDGAEPTDPPTPAPTTPPTEAPTSPPSAEPSLDPTAIPTELPSMAPTTISPTAFPSEGPTLMPTAPPSFGPTSPPTFVPTKVPSLTPTEKPTSATPTETPTVAPVAPATSSPIMPGMITEPPMVWSPSGAAETMPPMPACFKRGHSELHITLDNARMMLHDVGEGVLITNIRHEIHQVVQNHAPKVTVIQQKAEGLTVNVTIDNDYGGFMAKTLVDFVRKKRYQMFPNFFPMRIVRVKCTDWLRVPEVTAPPTFLPTPNPTNEPTTLKEEFQMEGIVNGFHREAGDNSGPFVHHTCVRLRGGELLDFPAVGYGNRVKTKIGWTGVPVTKTQCLGACKDITRCSGVEYYPFYRECWLYKGSPQFIPHPVQATEDKCWTGYLKEEWRIPYRAAFTGERARPERFIPVPKVGLSTPIVNDENVGIVPVASLPRVTSSTPVDTIPVLANAAQSFSSSSSSA